MTAKEIWKAKKPIVAKLLKDGWSITVALHKAGVRRDTMVYEFYRNDRKFYDLVKRKYFRKYTSPYAKLTAVPRTFINSKKIQLSKT